MEITCCDGCSRRLEPGAVRSGSARVDATATLCPDCVRSFGGAERESHPPAAPAPARRTPRPPRIARTKSPIRMASVQSVSDHPALRKAWVVFAVTLAAGGVVGSAATLMLAS